MKWVLVTATLQGRRPSNDDAVQAATRKHKRVRYLSAALCDGVGSRTGSGAVAKEVSQATLSAFSAVLDSASSKLEFLRSAGDSFARRLRSMRLTGSSERATTLAAFVMNERVFKGFWAGDSRLYALGAETGLRLLSRDDVDADGDITSYWQGSGALHGPLNSVLGEVDRDLLALCLTTDGVHGACEHDDLERFLAFVVDNRIAHGDALADSLRGFLDENLNDNATLAVAFRPARIPSSLRSRLVCS